MRNPLATVFCEDCEYSLPGGHCPDDKKYLRCKKAPKKAVAVVHRDAKLDYSYCTTERVMGHAYCFNFKPKEEN